ncbi:MAG: PilZ domain-containing protein [Kofleriaceae bacterium]
MTDLARIDLRLATEADWLKVFDPREATLRLVVAEPPAVGDALRIDVVVGVGGPLVVLRGEIVDHQAAEPDDGDATLVIVALGQSEREKINYVNGFVRGGMLNLRERRRLPVRLKVTYGGTAGPVDSVCRDISDDGIFIVAERPLPEATKLHMFVHLPSAAQPLQLAGTVSHTVVPADDDVPGMGITFTLDAPGAAALRAALDQLEAQLADGSLPPTSLG